MEVIKSGTLIEERPLSGKPFLTFGRSPTADVLLEHPSASRLHAVLQFRGSDSRAFLYDCGSTHGTFINKQRVKAQVMAPLRCVWGVWVSGVEVVCGREGFKGLGAQQQLQEWQLEQHKQAAFSTATSC